MGKDKTKMEDIKIMHEKAMCFAEKALALKKNGDIEKSFCLFRNALNLSIDVAHLYDECYGEEPSRSIFYRSAASIAMYCYEIDVGEDLIDEAFEKDLFIKQKKELQIVKKFYNEFRAFIRSDYKHFSEYLIDGFEALESDGVKVFYPMDNYLNADKGFVQCFCYMYDSFDRDVKSNFEKGLLDAFKKMNLKTMSCDVVKYVLEVVGYICGYESAYYIGRRIYFMDNVCKESNLNCVVYGAGIDVIKYISTNCNSLDVNIIKDIITSGRFLSEKVFVAFLALCRVEPAQFPQHLKLLRLYIKEEMNKNSIKFAEEACEMINEFINCVSLNVISEKIVNLDLSPNIIEKKVGDNWFVDVLLKGGCAPLEIYVNSKGNLAVIRKNIIMPECEIIIESNPGEYANVYKCLKNIYYNNSEEVNEELRENVDFDDYAIDLIKKQQGLSEKRSYQYISKN